MNRDWTRPAQVNTDQIIQDFRNHLREINQSSIQSASPSQYPSHFSQSGFIPENDLYEYLAIEKIRALLRSFHTEFTSLSVDPIPIRERCFKIFAILLLIGEGGYIKYFEENCLWDEKLPFESRPANFPNFPPNSPEDFWTSFHDAQWQFCAHSFSRSMVNNKLNDHLVLPILSSQKLVDNSDGGTISKITLHPDHHTLHENRQPPLDPNVFVIKSFDYNDQRQRNYYHSEVEAFRTLNCNHDYYAPPEIVSFYGSFIQNGTCNILLEYADQGNLEEYFKKTPPPVERDDILAFWHSMRPIAKGLARIHGTNLSADDTVGTFHGYHHDLKPANILVFSYGKSSPYHVTFKIADLGLSHFIQVRFYPSSINGHGLPGTRTYGSPETHLAREINPHNMNIPQKADVWSLACIYSVANCWVVGGQSYVDKFSGVRQQARQKSDLDPSDCFHDNVKLLPEVQHWHRVFLVRRARNTDCITEQLWHTFLDEAFSENVGARLWAEQIDHRMEKLLKDPDTINRDWQDSSLDSPPQTPTERRQRTVTMESFSNDDIRPEPGRSPLRDPRNFNWSTRRPIPERPIEHSPPLTDLQVSRVSHSSQTGESLPGLLEALSIGDTSMPSPIQSPRGLNIDSSQGYTPDVDGTLTGSPRQMSPPSSRYHENSQKPPTYIGARPHMERSMDGGPIPAEIVPATPNKDQMLFGSTAASPPSSSPKPEHKCQKHQSEGLGFMSVDDLLKWYGEKKCVPCADLKDGLKKRDHLFVVDNSISMKPHWPELLRLFGPFVKFIKDCDDDGIDLVFTQNAQEPMHRRNTTELISRVRALGGKLNAPSNPETVFRAIFNKDRRKTLRDGKPGPKPWWSPRKEVVDVPLTVYFFTDGVWQPRAELRTVIREVVDLLEQEPKKLPNHVGIQFIQFGKDPDCTKKLKAYDNITAYGNPELVRDIVDREPSDGNVWKMYLGSINPSFDDAECTCGFDA